MSCAGGLSAAETLVAQFAVDPTLDVQEPLRLRGYQAIADALQARGPMPTA